MSTYIVNKTNDLIKFESASKRKMKIRQKAFLQKHEIYVLVFTLCSAYDYPPTTCKVGFDQRTLEKNSI